jgi:hypothetical protein
VSAVDIGTSPSSPFDSHPLFPSFDPFSSHGTLSPLLCFPRSRINVGRSRQGDSRSSHQSKAEICRERTRREITRWMGRRSGRRSSRTRKVSLVDVSSPLIATDGFPHSLVELIRPPLANVFRLFSRPSFQFSRLPTLLLYVNQSRLRVLS